MPRSRRGRPPSCPQARGPRDCRWSPDGWCAAAPAGPVMPPAVFARTTAATWAAPTAAEASTAASVRPGRLLGRPLLRTVPPRRAERDSECTRGPAGMRAQALRPGTHRSARKLSARRRKPDLGVRPHGGAAAARRHPEAAVGDAEGHPLVAGDDGKAALRRRGRCRQQHRAADVAEPARQWPPAASSASSRSRAESAATTSAQSSPWALRQKSAAAARPGAGAAVPRATPIPGEPARKRYRLRPCWWCRTSPPPSPPQRASLPRAAARR